jgi:SAM-dependent methyltransferase
MAYEIPENQYDSFAEIYDADKSLSAYNVLYERPAIERLIDNVSGLKVLDLGCGSGKLVSERLLSPTGINSHGPAKQVIGVEGSEQMVNIANRKLRDKVTSGAFKVYVGDLNRPLPLSSEHDGTFDMAIASLVLHYLHDWSIVLSECKRLLKPNGILVFSTHHPSMDCTSEGFEARYFETQLVREKWRGIERPVEFWRRPLTEMCRFLNEAGFVIDKIEEPIPVEECRTVDPKVWERLSNYPQFIFFKCRPKV